MASLIGSGSLLLLVFFAVLLFLHFVPLGLWISALAADVNVGILTLVGMRMRRVPPAAIILPLIKANKAGLDVQVNQLEAHYLAGGNVVVASEGIKNAAKRVDEQVGVRCYGGG